jgi:ppGpp synthetase/RelA/SpoT-type nucleotidyltranferase
MPDIPPNLTEMDDHIAAVRENLRELVEQAAAYSGAADENLMSQRIDEQEALLERLTKRRDELSKPKLPATEAR